MAELITRLMMELCYKHIGNNAQTKALRPRTRRDPSKPRSGPKNQAIEKTMNFFLKRICFVQLLATVESFT